MKETFKAFYEPDDTFFEDAIFAFDTNTLLNIFRYTDKTRESFINGLRKKKDNIWLPQHAGYEFHRNLYTVYNNNFKGFRVLIETLNEFSTYSNKNLNKFLQDFPKHPRLDESIVNEIFSKISDSINDQINKISDLEEEYVGTPQSKFDGLHETINCLDDIFNGKIGTPLTEPLLQEFNETKEQRYKDEIPPGYKDKNKEENKFGDLLIWFQIIEFSKSSKKNIVLVTDDTKEDWWRREGGKTIGMRYELREEFINKTNGQNIKLIKPSRFIDLTGGDENSASVSEAKEFEKLKEDSSQSEKSLDELYLERKSLLDSLSLERKSLLDTLNSLETDERRFINDIHEIEKYINYTHKSLENPSVTLEGAIETLNSTTKLLDRNRELQEETRQLLIEVNNTLDRATRHE